MSLLQCHVTCIMQHVWHAGAFCRAGAHEQRGQDSAKLAPGGARGEELLRAAAAARGTPLPRPVPVRALFCGPPCHRGTCLPSSVHRQIDGLCLLADCGAAGIVPLQLLRDCPSCPCVPSCAACALCWNRILCPCTLARQLITRHFHGSTLVLDNGPFRAFPTVVDLCLQCVVETLSPTCGHGQHVSWAADSPQEGNSLIGPA